jgi:hypothetical protein
MFFNELSPLTQELLQQPTAFLGGFVSGLLGLDLNEDPLKSWLQRHATPRNTSAHPPSPPASGPQRITID